MLTNQSSIEASAIPQVTMPYIATDRHADAPAGISLDSTRTYRPTIETHVGLDENNNVVKTRQVDIYRALDPYTDLGEFSSKDMKHKNTKFHIYTRGSNYEARLGAYDGTATTCERNGQTIANSALCENAVFNDYPFIKNEPQLLYPFFVDLLDQDIRKIKAKNAQNTNNIALNKTFVPISGAIHGTGATFLTATKNLYTVGVSSVLNQTFTTKQDDGKLKDNHHTRDSYSTKAVPEVNLKAQTNGLLLAGGLNESNEGIFKLPGKSVDGKEELYDIIPYRITSSSFYDGLVDIKLEFE